MAINSDDIEVQKRAEELIQALKTMLTSDLIGAAVRLLADRKPDGAAAVLIDYMPNTSDPYVIDEIRYALQAVSVKKEKDKPVLDEAVLKALEDKNAIKHAAAGEVVARLGDADQRQEGQGTAQGQEFDGAASRGDGFARPPGQGRRRGADQVAH